MDFLLFWCLFFVVFGVLGYFKLLFLVALMHTFNYLLSDYETKAPPNDFNVCIVGAGFSGLGMAVKLQKIGIGYRIFEANPEPGGTWYSNVYPGCACDIQSHLYSYSFDPNPNWTRKYPKQEEIWHYIQQVVTKYFLRVEYNKRVKAVRWMKKERKYEVELVTGEKHIFNAVVYGAGALREPVIPDFKGADSFRGQALHSALWDKSVDLTGKRVAVIGTGASAVQIVPTIAPRVDQLHVFQRTPCWSAPRNDRPIPDWVKNMFNYVPGTLYLFRLFILLRQELIYFAVFRTNTLLGPWIKNDMKKYIRHTVKNPETANKLIPDYAPGCKRITPSDDYLAAYNLSNVHLVTSTIDRIVPEGIQTVDGKVTSVDVIIYATGYSVLESFFKSFDVYNGDGESMKDRMGDCPTAYLGITVPTYPNFFLLLGPHTGLGHNSIIWMIECEINYIAEGLKVMLERGIEAVAPKESALKEFQDFVEDRMQNKVFYKGCNSWYKNKGGDGVNYALWPSHLFHYWWLTRNFDLANFEIWK